ncbi:MAG: nucleotidyl transferase AbiEii/AbiGii toxin family protein [Actinomycetota bacterium]|nr:nucleotidyl transferase AbiEii/AbiGii toxin family protein [Actinomycetota bacterium]
MAADDNASDLSAFQMKVARLFFALPASRGFLLAGGAALLAQHLTARSTEDLDFFTAPERGHVLAARDALEAAARQRGWSAQRIHDSETFCRMVIRSSDAEILVDLAVNAPPDLPASATPAGPTLAPEELAGHKLLARAAQIDAGFDAKVLADMIAALDRFTDDEIPVPDDSSAAELRPWRWSG